MLMHTAMPANGCMARQQAARRTRVIAFSDASRGAGVTGKARQLTVPENPNTQVAQAAAAIESGWNAGIKRQRVEVLLPLIGATDLDDWPGGIQQQFKAAQPLVEGILRVIKQLEGLEGPLTPEIWDHADAVACYRSENMAAVIFPSAAVVDKLKKLAEGPNAPKLLIIVNPQWESKGNLMSDFGIGPWRAAKEQFVSTFTTTYWLRQQRVYGDVVRVLYGHPGEWQIHVQPINTSENTLIGAQDTLPTYQQIEDLLRARPESSMNKSVVQRLQEEFTFNRKSL